MEINVAEVNSFLAVLATLIGATALALHRRAAAKGKERDDAMRHYRGLLEEQRTRIDQMHRHILDLEARADKRAETLDKLSRSLRLALDHIRDLWRWITDASPHILPTAPRVPEVPDELRLIVDFDEK